jgi:hypothetical protein
LLIGFGSGLIIFPIGIGVYSLFKNTLERRKVKIMMKKGEFLTPIDQKDYDAVTWAGQIIPDENAVKHLNDSIFKRGIKTNPEYEQKLEEALK